MGFLTPKSKLKTSFIKKTKTKNNILTFAHISTAGGSQALQSVGRKPTRGGFQKMLSNSHHTGQKES